MFNLTVWTYHVERLDTMAETSHAFYEATMHLPGIGVGEVKPSDQGHADSPGPGARAELLITIPAIYPLEAWDRCHPELPRHTR